MIKSTLSKKAIVTIFFLSIFFTVQSQQDNSKKEEKKGNQEVIVSKKNVRFEYYPNLEAYFDKTKKVFIYRENGEWVTGETLPERVGGYSLFKNYKVEITDYDGDTPYDLIKTHRKLFPYNSKGRFEKPKKTSNKLP